LTECSLFDPFGNIIAPPPQSIVFSASTAEREHAAQKRLRDSLQMQRHMQMQREAELRERQQQQQQLRQQQQQQQQQQHHFHGQHGNAHHNHGDRQQKQDEESAVCNWQNCGASFDSLTELGQHIREDHILQQKRENRKYKRSGSRCFWVGCSREKPFNSFYNLEMHIRFRHTGEKPYQCEQCPQRFAQKSDLKSHRELHKEELQIEERKRGSFKRRSKNGLRDTQILMMESSSEEE